LFPAIILKGQAPHLVKDPVDCTERNQIPNNLGIFAKALELIITPDYSKDIKLHRKAISVVSNPTSHLADGHCENILQNMRLTSLGAFTATVLLIQFFQVGVMLERQFLQSSNLSINVTDGTGQNIRDIDVELKLLSFLVLVHS